MSQGAILILKNDRTHIQPAFSADNTGGIRAETGLMA